jgi:SAM-dependent methyltransferase
MSFHDCRKIVRSCYPSDHYYVKAYADDEQGYWGNIPALMGRLIKPNDAVLDIGPGYGCLAAWARIQNAKVLTADRVSYLSQELITVFSIKAFTIDIERGASLLPHSLDHIIMTEVLEHLNFNPVLTLNALNRALVPGGNLYLSTPLAGGKSSQTQWPRMTHPAHYPGPKDPNRLDPVDSPFKLPVFNSETMDFNNPKWYDGHVWHYNWEELYRLMNSCHFTVTEASESRSRGGRHAVILATKPPVSL